MHILFALPLRRRSDTLEAPPFSRRTVTHPVSHDRRHAERRQDLPDALAACSASIGRHFRGELSEDAMRDAVCAFAMHMHSAGVPPERAIAQLKETILRVPEVSARPAMDRSGLLRVLVEAAI